MDECKYMNTNKTYRTTSAVPTEERILPTTATSIIIHNHQASTTDRTQRDRFWPNKKIVKNGMCVCVC